METDTLFEPTTDNPAIPDKLLRKLTEHHQHVRRIEIARQRGKTQSWEAINTLRLIEQAGGGISETPEEIAKVCMQIAIAHAEEKNEPGNYRAQIHVVGKGGKAERPRQSVFFVSPNDDEAPIGLETLEESDQRINAVLERALGLVQILTDANASMQQRMTEMASMSTATSAPLVQVVETMLAKYNEGLDMTARAMSMIFDHNTAKAEAEYKAERDKELIGLLTAVLPKAVERYLEHMKRKEEASDESEAKPEPKKTNAEKRNVAVAEIVTRPAKPKETNDTPDPPMSDDNLIAQSTKSFRDSIGSEQWIKITMALTKRQIQAFDDLTSSDDDDETLESIEKFRNMLKPKDIASLTSILDQDQIGMVLQLIGMLDKAENKKD